jgi:hypothetical protein
MSNRQTHISTSIQIRATQATLNGLSLFHRPLGFYISAQNVTQQISIFKNLLSTSNKVQIQVYNAKQVFEKRSTLTPITTPTQFSTGSHSKATNKQHGQADLKHPRFPRHQLGSPSSPQIFQKFLTASCLFFTLILPWSDAAQTHHSLLSAALVTYRTASSELKYPPGTHPHLSLPTCGPCIRKGPKKAANVNCAMFSLNNRPLLALQPRRFIVSVCNPQPIVRDKFVVYAITCTRSKSVCRPDFQLSETDEQSQIVHQTWKR